MKDVMVIVNGEVFTLVSADTDVPKSSGSGIVVVDGGKAYKLFPVSRKLSTEIPETKTPVSSFELTVRTENILKNMGIDYMEDVFQKSEREMLQQPNFGRRSLNELRQVLAKKWPGVPLRIQ